MFTQPAPPSSAGFLQPTTLTSPPATKSRPSRLRGLSYLRNYTQNHLLSRDSSGANSSPGPAALGSSGSSQNTSTPSSSQRRGRPQSLTRALTSPNSRRRRKENPAIEESLSPPPDPVRRSASHIPTGIPDLPTGLHSPPPSEHSDDLSSEQDTEARKRQKKGATPEGEHESATTEEQTDNDAEMTRTRSATTGDLSVDMLPSVRFSAHYDPRSTRQSLSFTPVSRTLPTGKEVIKVGRYSEREQQTVVPANTPSAAPVGFKSKVVSRRHCEFWYEDGKWYIRDVKSSSGTFLNHIRLSPPGNESKPYVVNDGDIVQLGIDFRGGEEMIFRCVKMRIELNRGWQAKPNNFNMATHKRLRNLTSTAASATSGQDCSICLNAIAPCQSLFVAPCSHTWHYKCIRELLTGPSHPIFTCPNCRAAADLDAEVEEPSEEWLQLDSGEEAAEAAESREAGEAAEAMEVMDEDGDSASQSGPAIESSQASVNEDGAVESTRPADGDGSIYEDAVVSPANPGEGEAGDVTMMLDSPAAPAEADALPTGPTAPGSIPIPIPTPRTDSDAAVAARLMRTPSPNGVIPGITHEGPLTPRNDAGPWVFDGDAGRSSQDITRTGAMQSLGAAATQMDSTMT